jgi:hypothetical protein
MVVKSTINQCWYHRGVHLGVIETGYYINCIVLMRKGEEFKTLRHTSAPTIRDSNLRQFAGKLRQIAFTLYSYNKS